MRIAAVAAVLGTVLAASALDLGVGLLWVAALASLVALRRRLRVAPWLALLACAGVVAAGAPRGWLDPPAPASYATGWLPVGGVREDGGRTPGTAEAVRLRDEIRALAQLETGLTGVELERRAGELLTFARRAHGVRARAPAEVAGVEAAARRLARTLAAPEFRDLEGRRRRAAEYLAELARRAAEEPDDLEAIRRALDPAAMARVSLRAVREDVAEARRAAAALLRALGGGEPTASVSVTVTLDEAAGALRRSLHWEVSVEPPARLVRIEPGALRVPGGAAGGGEYAADGGVPRSLPPGGWVELGGARRVRLTAERVAALRPAPVTGPLRQIAFGRVAIDPEPAGGELPVTVGLDEVAGFEAPLAAPWPPSRLERVRAPRGALHWVSAPGTSAGEGSWDVWTPAGPGIGRVVVELAPAVPLLRSRWLVRARPYLYRPNATAVVAAAGLAALTLVLGARPRRATPAAHRR